MSGDFSNQVSGALVEMCKTLSPLHPLFLSAVEHIMFDNGWSDLTPEQVWDRVFLMQGFSKETMYVPHLVH